MNGIHRIRVYKWNKIDEKHYRSFFINPDNRFEEVNCIIVPPEESWDIADIISYNNENLLVCVFKGEERKARIEEEIEIARYTVTGIEY